MIIDTIEDAQYELNVRIAEACEDQGFEPDVIAHDILVNVCWDLSNDLALELCRRELGYVPYELLSRLGNVDFLES